MSWIFTPFFIIVACFIVAVRLWVYVFLRRRGVRRRRFGGRGGWPGDPGPFGSNGGSHHGGGWASGGHGGGHHGGGGGGGDGGGGGGGHHG